MVISSSGVLVDEEMVKIALGWISQPGMIATARIVGLVLNCTDARSWLNGAARPVQLPQLPPACAAVFAT